jgi:transposase InsO family protein
MTRKQVQAGAIRPLRRFHTAQRNALWIADFNFPPLQWRDGSALQPVVILAILDHHSRRLPHFAAHPAHDALAVEQGLREVIAGFGLPTRFYHDNGAELTSGIVLGALAELGIQHIASRVGLPEGRGAVERFYAKDPIMRRSPSFRLICAHFPVPLLRINDYCGAADEG